MTVRLPPHEGLADALSADQPPDDPDIAAIVAMRTGKAPAPDAPTVDLDDEIAKIQAANADYAEATVAARLIDYVVHDSHGLMFVKGLGWLICGSDNLWRADDGTSRRIATRYLDQLVVDGAPEKKIGRLRNKRALDAILALSAVDFTVNADAIDADPMMLSVKNGVVDLRTGALRPRERADRMMKCARVAYDADATCPIWMRCLGEWLSDDLVSYYQRAVGYSVTGETREQVVFFRVDPGETGKSLTQSIYASLLGEYTITADVRTFLQRGKSEHPTALAHLDGARLVAAAEIDRGEAIAAALLKLLSGEDTVAARRMRQDFYTFQPRFKLWFATNNLPKTEDASHGMWRRMRPFPWRTPPTVDHDLKHKLRAELPGILAWIVRGAVAWNQHGLGEMPLSMRNLHDQWRRDADPIATFIAERLQKAPDGITTAAEVRRAYLAWCASVGEAPASDQLLTPALEARGFRRVRSAVRSWKGFTISPIVKE